MPQIGEFGSLIVLVLVLILGWFAFRIFSRITAALFRVGCFIIFLAAAAAAALIYFDLLPIS